MKTEVGRNWYQRSIFLNFLAGKCPFPWPNGSTFPNRILRWYAQSESIIKKIHSKTIVLQDYRFYLLVFFLSLLLFTVPRCKTIVLIFKGFANFPIGFPIVFKNHRGVWFYLYLLVLCVQIKFIYTYYKDMCVLLLPCNPPPPQSTYAYTHACNS
jgi:hypothetical protein